MKKRFRFAKGQEGQSLVEFALSMIFLFIFLLGTLDLGRVYYIYIALEDAAGEAAVFLSVNPTCDQASAGKCADPNNAEHRAQTAVGEMVDWSKTEFEVEYPTIGKGAGNTVKVAVSYRFDLYTPIISQIVGDDNLIITAIATQTIVSEQGG